MRNKQHYIHTEDIHNTQSPEIVIPHILKFLSPKSVIDVGCGIGTWLNIFEKLGVEDVIGVDGNYVDKSLLKINESRFVKADLTKPFNLNRKFDLAICLEVAEHLPGSSADIIVKTLVDHSETIIFSAAIPGQGGQNHINEQWPPYWIQKFGDHGYYFHDLIRPLIWEDERVQWWYKQNIFVVSTTSTQNNDYDSIVHPDLFKRKVQDLLDYQMRINKGQFGIKNASKIFFNSIINLIRPSR